MHRAQFIGTAGWSIQARWAARFPGDGSHLERYARVLDAVEINSSFYRPHRRTTYERWAASVSKDFRFAVKAPRTMTHERRLVDCRGDMERFAGEIAGLGEKLGVVLVQLPPSLSFNADVAAAFFTSAPLHESAKLACEPRHKSWFTAEADALLAELRVARVAADPASVAGAGEPGGWTDLAYYRWHGSPRMYWSNYEGDALRSIEARLDRHKSRGQKSWLIFDNTAAGCATGNALSLTPEPA